MVTNHNHRRSVANPVPIVCKSLQNLEINLHWNYILDEGVQSIVKGIPTNNNLKRLHLNFVGSNLSPESYVTICQFLHSSDKHVWLKVEDLKINLSGNYEFKDEELEQTFANNWHWIRHTSTMIMVGHHLSPARDVYNTSKSSTLVSFLNIFPMDTPLLLLREQLQKSK